MVNQELFEQVLRHKEEILARGTPLGVELLKKMMKTHPADVAEFLEDLDQQDAIQFFLIFPREFQLRLFHEVSHSLQVSLLEALSEVERSAMLGHLSIDDLTDFFEDLSDDELKHYLKVLHKKDRERVVSLLQFSPESAGDIMYTDVLTLMQDFTVEKSIHILQRLRPNRALHNKIYVTNQNNELMGHINLEDLVLKSPKTRLSSILRLDAVIVSVDEDRQDVARTMMHYGENNVPVVGHDNTFLGVIPSEALAEIIEEEASEDIYRMSALTPTKYTYFETPFTMLFYQRSTILIVLLMVQTLSSMILMRYEYLLYGFFTYFISMLISAGGNASSQASGLAIQGIATGELDAESSYRFIKRECAMAVLIAAIMGIFSFARMLIVHYISRSATAFNWVGSVAVTVSLMLIIITSIMLGSSMPFILKRFGIDPAHSAGPLLTTLIDVVGLLIYCVATSWIVSIFA